MVNVNVTEKLFVLFLIIWNLDHLIEYLGEVKCER